MINKFRVALIQNLVHSKKTDTLQAVTTSLQEAAAKGSQVCILGETFNSPYTKPLLEANAEDFSNEKDRETYDMMRSISEKLGLCIIGSIPEKQDGKYYNSALCFNKGKLLGTYRKTHLFDIDIPGQITYFESKTFSPGQDLCVIDTEYGRFGLGICYDIRFPEFAQCMRNKGCQFLIYPGAFNQTTGPLHWELLMRARAVDYQVYLAGVSTARYQGDDPSIYQAWGHSTLVDPMGRILNTCEQQPAVLVSDIDLTLLESVRQQIPVSNQRRNDLYEILCKK